MANFKFVISDPKMRKAYQKEIDQYPSGALGKKIGDSLPGAGLGLQGYEFQITGGSDFQGFPMRRDFDGIGRRRLLLSFPPGYHPEAKGRRKRKSVRGNSISSEISQINIKVVTYGPKPLEEIFAGQAKKAEPKKEKPEKAEEKKEAAPKETVAKAEEKMGVKKLE